MPIIDRISIHALREESDQHAGEFVAEVRISIHALREESDVYSRLKEMCVPIISIHALREESDRMLRHSRRWSFISIHALREESDVRARRASERETISIHALREESDMVYGRLHASIPFQSTLSVRRATRRQKR